MDNAFDPKVFLVVCSTMLGLFFICLGLYLKLFQGEPDSVQQQIVLAKDSSMIIYSGIEAFTLVQLFNWFPRKWRGITMSMAESAATLGYVTTFLFDGWWVYFPLVPFKKPDFLSEFANRHFAIGAAILVISVIDYFTFYNYPMQRAIILAKTERSISANFKLINIASQATDKTELFSEFFKGENRSKMGFSVTFSQVF